MDEPIMDNSEKLYASRNSNGLLRIWDEEQNAIDHACDSDIVDSWKLNFMTLYILCFENVKYNEVFEVELKLGKKVK